MKADIVREYLESIGKERANAMTGVEIHDAIYDQCGESFLVSTILGIRQKFTGVKKTRGGPEAKRRFNKFKTAP